MMGRQSETRYAQTAACRKRPMVMHISGAVAGDLRSKAKKISQVRHSSLCSE
jgi:hypothetical protein